MDDAGWSGPLESGQDAGLEQFSDWLHVSMDEHVGDSFSSDLPLSSHMYNEASQIGHESPDVIWSVDNGGTLEKEQSECPSPSLARTRRLLQLRHSLDLSRLLDMDSGSLE